MEVTETGGIADEPKMIIHLDTYETEKLQSGQPVQLHVGMANSIHKTLEVQPEANSSFKTIQEKVETLQSQCVSDPKEHYDDVLFALEALVDEIQATNRKIVYQDSKPVVEAYEEFISNDKVRNSIESYWYYDKVWNNYR